MAKRKGSLSTVVAFMSEATQEQVKQKSAQGSADIVDYKIADIVPDAAQPRQLLPEVLIDQVVSGGMTAQEAMHQWLSLADDRDADANVKKNVQELRRLAAAIAQHGLINPISIRPRDDNREGYVIVTGERRFWSHVLLSLEKKSINSGENTIKPERIRATVVPEGSSIRAHQLIENLVREDINVVEKAFGMWALRFELSGVPSNNSDAYRRHSVPTGTKLVPWKQVEEALDLSRQYRSRIVNVLELGDAAKALVSKHNLAEATIRPIVEKLRPHPDLQIQAINQLVVWQEAESRGEGEGRAIVPSVRRLVEQLLAAQNKPVAKAGKVQSRLPVVGDFGRKVRGTLRFVQKMDDASLALLAHALEDKQNADVLDDLKTLRKQLETILRTLD